MSLKVLPPSVLTCHCTVGVGLPLAAAVKVAVRPGVDRLVRRVRRDRGREVHRQGGGAGGGRAGGVDEDRPVLVAVLRGDGGEAEGGEVAPGMSLKVLPPSVLTCHCTVGVGLPLAAAVKVAVSPALTVRFVGFVVIVGAWLTWLTTRFRRTGLVLGSNCSWRDRLLPRERFWVVKSPLLEAKSMTSWNVLPAAGVKLLSRLALMVPPRVAAPETVSRSNWSLPVPPMSMLRAPERPGCNCR